MSVVADMPAAELRRRIGARELSVVDVVEACLDRVGRQNGTVNALVTLNPRALDEAREIDRLLARGERPGPLCGLPVGIKDVTPVAGLRTTYGSPIYADHVPAEDALVVRRLRQAGAVVLGKTNCPEFAAGANTFNDVFGRTRNPWDLSKSAGGSTGGGAAALASGMIALAEGTDLGGSLRIPASFCGVVGLRPSIGLVPTHPTDWTWDTLEVSGPMGRTVEDVALMLQVMAGPSPLSPFARSMTGRDFVEAVRAGVGRGLRVAYCPDVARIGIEADIERVCREAAQGLRGADIEVEEVDLDFAYARPAFLAIRGLWFVAHMHPRLDQSARFGPNVSANLQSGLQTTTLDLADAEAARGRLWHQCRDLLSRFDHLLPPCTAVAPFPVEQSYPDYVAGQTMSTYVDWIAPTFVLSLTGLPIASVPCGLDAGGLPVGVQIVGRPGDEEGVLALAAQIQRDHPLGAPHGI